MIPCAAEQPEEATEEEGGEGEGMKTVTLRTAPNDPRFPTSNQARHCYVRYNEVRAKRVCHSSPAAHQGSSWRPLEW